MAARSRVEVLSTHTPDLFGKAVARAAELLRAGEVVAVPTETVYGLAANALDPAAVARIYEAKGRPAHNPLIVHVADLAMARRCVKQFPDSATRLAKAFWPGPLTLVLNRSDIIPDLVTAGGGTVGIRWPSHPFIQQLIRACDFPLAAPSANRSNEVSPTNADHVRKSLGDRIPLIIDGGQAQVGIESTVLDLTVNPPRILRPGMIHQESLTSVIGETGSAGGPAGTHLKSPGQLQKHYSPKAMLRISSWKDDADLRSQLAIEARPPDNTHIIAHTHIPASFENVSVIPHDAEAFARALYAELHRCDEAGAELIVVEAVPHGPEWQAIADRLQRAAS